MPGTETYKKIFESGGHKLILNGRIKEWDMGSEFSFAGNASFDGKEYNVSVKDLNAMLYTFKNTPNLIPFLFKRSDENAKKSMQTM